jgi:uncharacterized C2H2 Zn-finger protein
LSKINPGSNFNEDNDVRTAAPGGLQDIKIMEPKVNENGKLQCPTCNRIFNSREDYISHALSKHQVSQPENAHMYLATVPYSIGFHFFITEGRYTGETAVNLATFARKIEVAPIESIDFHFKKADFQKWITDVIGDKQLALMIENLEKDLAGEPLRTKLVGIINTRVKELENQIPPEDNSSVAAK